MNAMELIESKKKQLHFKLKVAETNGSCSRRNRDKKIGFPQNIPMLIAYGLAGRWNSNGNETSLLEPQNRTADRGGGGGGVLHLHPGLHHLTL